MLRSLRSQKFKVMQQHSIKLIDSTYPAKQAREVIMTLLNDKIRFLGVQILSIEERFGDNTEHMRQRIKELEHEKRELLRQLESLEDENTPLEIDCQIDLKVVAEAASY